MSPEPTLVSSALAFGTAWLTSGIGILLVLVGRYGEFNDLVRIGNWKLKIPRRGVMYALGLAFFIIGPFLAFHREMVAHSEQIGLLAKNSEEERRRLDIRISELENINETIRTQRDHAHEFIDSIREGASKDISLTRDHYAARLQDARKSYDERVDQLSSLFEERKREVLDIKQEFVDNKRRLMQSRWWVDFLHAKHSIDVYISPGLQTPGDYAFFIRTSFPSQPVQDLRIVGVSQDDLDVVQAADETRTSQRFLIRNPDVSRRDLIQLTIVAAEGMADGTIELYFPPNPTLMSDTEYVPKKPDFEARSIPSD